MPKHSINAPHRRQERDNSCLPACVRMVLAFYGVDKSEDELRRLFRTKGFGTHAFHVAQGLPSLGFAAAIVTSALQDVQQLIEQNQP